MALSVLVTAAIGVAHLSRGDQGPADTAGVAAQEPDVGLSEVDSVASIRPLPRDAEGPCLVLRRRVGMSDPSG
jgi:hypothetical protein